MMNIMTPRFYGLMRVIPISNSHFLKFKEIVLFSSPADVSLTINNKKSTSMRCSDSDSVGIRTQDPRLRRALL